jgi:ABC-2 type transport system ATP-binding protein
MNSNFEIWSKNLTKIYSNGSNHTLAVDHIDLRVKPGIHGFLGPNGAGKTTTIHMLIGAISITEGESYIRGKKAGSRDVREIIGFLPQDPKIYSNMSALQYISFMGRLYGLKKLKVRKRTEYLLDFFELTEVKDKLISEYSGGMRQKVGLASALIHEPELLILDEPTTNLDPNGRKQIIEFIKKLSKNMSIFVSSHLLSEIEEMCEEITILNQGKIVLTDTIKNIKQNYSGPKKNFIIDTNSNEIVLKYLIEDYNIKAWIDASDNYIHLFHNKENILYQIIANILAKEKILIKKFLQPETTLQDIFIKLTKKEGD